MPPLPASGMDEPNRRFVAAILRAHIKGGTIPPRWTVARLVEVGTSGGLNIAAHPGIGGDR